MIWIDCNPHAGRKMRDMHPWKRIPDSINSACCASLSQIIDLGG